MENKSRNNKSWHTRKSDTGRSTFDVQAKNNPAIDENHEDIAQMKTELGLVLKDMALGAEKVNAVNYLMRPPPPVEEYYYEKNVYVVNDQMEGFRPNAHKSNTNN